MSVRTGNYPRILLLAAFFIFAAPAAGRADANLFRLFPELQLNGFYGDNIPLRTTNEIGDFGSTMVGGFFLDYTSAARYASLHYDTFVQLFTHQTKYDRGGEGQYVQAVDDENLSPTTKLRLNELFFRDASGLVMITTSSQAPQFNAVAAELLLAKAQASVNWFNAELSHDWGRNWSSELWVHQETFLPSGNSATSNTSYLQSIGSVTEYRFSDRVSLGPGYRFYDFRFSSAGRPDQEAHWPLMQVTWQATENLHLSGLVGPVISYTQGKTGQEINPAGLGWLVYTVQRGHLEIHGGQEPGVTSGVGAAGQLRSASGLVAYDFTQRLTGTAGGGYYQESGRGANLKFASWGFRVNERVNQWLSAYTAFTEIRRNQNVGNATGDYFMVGLNISIEAFRWSWQ